MPSTTPPPGLDYVSDSNDFSDIMRKIRIIHKKCPKCLLFR